ncbi:ABC transporter ATP-binding protein [Bradyrhizobium mercantei]|uniref:ABC transporter ATP-binding protein n=1 Tax=Bradyrhizobium mercantei TaxID=1904807 RepID=UPI000977F735|nr:ABC transporter ATP-binding protein [Bradyrhizobium mercantei]
MPEAQLLRVNALKTFYGDFQALYGVDIEVSAGQIVAIIGANGAGKSTLLNSIVGLNPAPPSAIRFCGTDIGGEAPYRIVRRGLTIVPEGRRLFTSLSVEENLLIGAEVKRPGEWTLAKIYQLFPILRDFRNRPARLLSGGQQQMVAIGRALMSNPKLLLCDELSLGLAPVVVKEIYLYIKRIVAGGVSAVIVEQDIQQALKIADHVYCMLEGRIALQGPARSLSREAIAAAYFGV